MNRCVAGQVPQQLFLFGEGNTARSIERNVRQSSNATLNIGQFRSAAKLRKIHRNDEQTHPAVHSASVHRKL